MKQTLKSVLLLFISYISMKSLMYSSALMENNFFSNSFFSVIVYLVIVYFLFNYFKISKYKDEKKYLIFSIVSSLILSFASVIGYNITVYDYSFLNVLSTYKYIFGHFFLIFSVFNLVKENYSKVEKSLTKNFDLKFLNKIVFEKHAYIKVFLLILLAWLPVFLAFYPGIFSYDAPYQYSDYMYKVFDSGNPVIHTLVVGFCLDIGHNVFNNYNIGVLIYSIFQSLVLSLTMSYIITYLNKRGANIYLKFISLLLFMFLPTHSLLAITSTKDVIFSCAVAILFIKLIDLLFFYSNYSKKEKKLFLFSFFLFLLLTFIFRPNGLYGYTFMAIFAIIFLKENRKEVFVISLIAYSLYGFYDVSMNRVLNIVTPKNSISPLYSLPLQQMGRLYNYGSLSKKDKIYINGLISDDLSKEPLLYYSPRISDPIIRKISHDTFRKKTAAFRTEYFKLSLEYPLLFADEFLESTMGYWYISDILPDKTCYRPYLEMYTEDRDFNTGDDIKNDTKYPWLYTKYKDVVENGNYQKIPVLSFFMSNAVYNLLLILAVFYLALYRKYKSMVPLMFLFGLVGTNFLGPVALTRYCYYLYLCMPLIFLLFKITYERNSCDKLK